MTIPPKFQLFQLPVVLSDKDAQRLGPYLTSWRSLFQRLAHVNEPDLQRLVVLELMGDRRWSIVSRLLSRLGRIQRTDVEKRARRFCR